MKRVRLIGINFAMEILSPTIIVQMMAVVSLYPEKTLEVLVTFLSQSLLRVVL